MPQLIPFYFFNQVTFSFILLILIIYIISKYLLGKSLRTFFTRIYIDRAMKIF